MIGIIILLLSLLIFEQFRMSDLEKFTIKEYSDRMMTYMNVLEKDNLDHYICYTVVYYKNEYDKNNVRIEEITKFINSHFKLKVNKKQIQEVGITPYMIEQYITYNSTTNEYIITTDELSPSVIAETPLIKYDIKEMRKKGKNTYEVIYNQYKVKSPHEILNFYMDKKDDLAVKNINDYLSGNSNRKNLEKYLTNKNIGKFGKHIGTIKVQYKIHKNNILVFSREGSK